MYLLVLSNLVEVEVDAFYTCRDLVILHSHFQGWRRVPSYANDTQDKVARAIRYSLSAAICYRGVCCLWILFGTYVLRSLARLLLHHASQRRLRLELKLS